MTTKNIIRELEVLPMPEKLYVIEQALKAIRIERERSLKSAVDSLYKDYTGNKDLTAFTKLDTEPFYETR